VVHSIPRNVTQLLELINIPDEFVMSDCFDFPVAGEQLLKESLVAMMVQLHILHP
jgi:hypothetical protein